MEKIKAISERLHRSAVEYTEIRLIIAKNIFAFFGFLFFTGFLFSIGGFDVWPLTLTTWSAFLYFFFPVFVGSICWLLYELSRYLCIILIPRIAGLRFIIAIFLLLVWLGVTVIHLRLINLPF